MPQTFGPYDQSAIGRRPMLRNGSAAESPISRFQAGNGESPSRPETTSLTRIFGVPLEQFLTEGGKQHLSQPVQETASQRPVSLVFVAIEETLRATGISEPAAAEIAGVVELALENLRVPHGMNPHAALRRIIGWEVPEILARQR
jgi:hypothetical protein